MTEIQISSNHEICVPQNSDISVIVQGPIYGPSFGEEKNKFTKHLLASIRRILPGSEIVLSTWEGQDANGLDFDHIVFSTDPGSVVYIDERNYMFNVNRQIVSTINGLKKATRIYAIKMRSDLLINSSDFLRYWSLYSLIRKSLQSKFLFLQEPIVIANVTSVNPRCGQPFPFHPCDWFYFGLTCDIINVWDIPLCDEGIIARWYQAQSHPHNHPLKYSKARYQAEQYIWVQFLKKHIKFDFDHSCDCTNDNVFLSENVFAANTVILPLEKLGIVSQKHTQNLLYMSYMYSYSDWVKLLRSHLGISGAFKVDLKEVTSIECLRTLRKIKHQTNTLFSEIFSNGF